MNIPLLSITKNLLKASIVSIFYTFLLPEVAFNYFYRFFKFYNDCTLRSFNIPLILTTRVGASYFNLSIYFFILLEIA